jgi:hypothetical protein
MLASAFYHVRIYVRAKPAALDFAENLRHFVEAPLLSKALDKGSV